MLSFAVATPAQTVQSDRHYAPLALLTCLLLLSVMLVVIPSIEWGAMLVYLIVIAVTALLLYQRGIKPVDPTFPPALFVLAILVKLLGSTVRYWTVVDLYNGAADALFYHEHGQVLAQYFKLFDFSIIATYQVRGVGSTYLAYITGLLYSVMPTSMAGAFFFFAMLAFIGSVLSYRAICVAWPMAARGYYRMFVFFIPSLLFWPASLGKDAWLFFCSGLVLWGWVSFIRRANLLGLVWLALGLMLINLIRPHFAAFLVLGMGAAYLLYSTRGQRSIISWLIGVVAVAFLVVYMVQSGAQFLKLDEFSLDALQESITKVQDQTTEGGSKYQTVSLFTPWGLVWGLITTVSRPFPWEAHNAQALISALEATSWSIFCWWQRRALWEKIRQLRSDPVAGFAFFYSLVSLLALTALGNFGILARERVLILPFFWALFV